MLRLQFVRVAYAAGRRSLGNDGRPSTPPDQLISALPNVSYLPAFVLEVPVEAETTRTLSCQRKYFWNHPRTSLHHSL